MSACAATAFLMSRTEVVERGREVSRTERGGLRSERTVTVKEGSEPGALDLVLVGLGRGRCEGRRGRVYWVENISMLYSRC